MSVGFAISVFFLAMGGFSPAMAGTEFCSDYKKNPDDMIAVIDGNDPYVQANLPSSSFGIDMNCEFRNFSISTIWPNGLTPTLNFYTPTKTEIYLVAFDNVWFSGNMACANIDHKLWVVNSEEGAFSGACQDIMIPAETIDKQSPAATASVGVPFTYELTLPSMNYPAGTPSSNDLGTITVVDDLAATGADLTLVSLSAYNKGTATAIPITNFSDSTDTYLHFALPNINAGDQVVVELTVVLNDTPVNQTGRQFTNTAKWSFSRWIDLDEDGIQDANEYFNPLPGESGISTTMTIVAPNLVVNKTSNTTALNVGDPATFTIDVQNSGGGAAWNATILDRIPTGMCVNDPTGVTPGLDAKLVDADGTTLVKDLVAGADYTATYAGCELSLTLTDSAPIAPEQRLIINYTTQIDPLDSPDFPEDGALLTNIAGATRWFSGDSGHEGRQEFVRTLTDGTPGVVDFQDSQTVMAAMHGYFFEKTVQNLTSLANPATIAAPGDTLRYRLRVFNVDQNIQSIVIDDLLDLDVFDPSSFDNVAITAGTGYNANWSFEPDTGHLQVSGAPTLNVDVHGELVVHFDITLRSDLANDTSVSNQASLTAIDFKALSDDPYINGVSSPDVAGDEDPTVVTIQTPGPLAKANTQTTATIGERFEYTITVPAIPSTVPLYDVQILDTLPDNLKFVSARVVTSGAWTLDNMGSGNSLVLEDPVTGIDIPTGGQAKIAITVELLNASTNQGSVLFSNSATYTYNRANGVDSTQLPGGGNATPNMTVFEPLLAAVKTASFAAPAGKPASDPATVGDVLEYQVSIRNNGKSTAFDTNIVDTLPANLEPLPDSATATINGVAISDFVVNPSTPAGSILVWGRENGDGSLDIPAGQTLVLTYQVTVVDASSVSSFTNSAYVDWTSLDEDYPIDPFDNPAPGRERTGTGCGTTGIVQPNDYCSGPANFTVYTVDNTAITKSVWADSYAETPESTADPILRVGDTVTYDLTLHLQEYTTRQVVVEDVLPEGLVLESFAILAGTNFAYSPGSQPAAAATGTLRWEFGDIINTPNGISTDDDLVIRYTARVVIDAPALGVNYDPSNLLDNQVKLFYAGGDPVAYPARLTATARIDVRQPLMTALSKTGATVGRSASGDGSSANPYQVDIANDVMQFQLQSCNNGLAPAYNVQITDLLASQLDETRLSTPVVTLGGSVLAAGSDYTYTPPSGRGGALEFGLNTPVAPGQCARVDYTIGFYTDLTAGEDWSNQAKVTEYESLPENGRLYASTEMAQVWMTNQSSVQPLAKALFSSATATIGETVTYQITVPGTPVNAALDNVVITDTLDAALVYVGASVSAPFTMNASSSAQNVSLVIDRIPAGEQAVITLTARVANNAQANAGYSFTNTADYTYTDIPAGAVTSGSSAPLTIAEPAVTVNKAVTPDRAPTAGDILTYTVQMAAAAGSQYSSAYDLVLTDSLGAGLAYVAGSASLNGVAVADPEIDGQELSWLGGIDIPEGTTASLLYQVRVLDSVAIGQILTNSVTARWTSLDGSSADERTGSGVAPDDYVATASTTLVVGDSTTFAKVRVSDSYGETDNNVRIGDLIDYELRLGLQEGTHTGISVTDQLPVGLQYVEMVSATSFGTPLLTPPAPVINGQTLSWALGSVTNPVDGDASNDVLVLRYRVRVLKDTLAQTPVNQTLSNNATLTYEVAGNTVSRSGSASVVALQPMLTVAKSVAPAGGDTVIGAGEILTYTVNIANSGAAPAYDTILIDTLPLGLRQGEITVSAMTLVNSGSSLPPLAPSYEPATGVATWNFDSNSANTYTIPAGETLRVVYTVRADDDLGPGLTLTNTAQVTLYHSLDDEAVPSGTTVNDRQVYGPTNMAQQTLTSPEPGGLLKENPSIPAVTIGQEFTYTITVPAVPQPIALHDVRIFDDLGLTGVDLGLISISKLAGTQPWNPVNTGSPTSLVIEDVGAGIEIPANEQIVIGVTVRLNNVAANSAGLTFSNTAAYTYNQVDGDAATLKEGGSNTTVALRVVEPAVTVHKSVVPETPPQNGDILTYTVTLTAAAGADFSDAFDTTLVDILSPELLYVSDSARVGGVSVEPTLSHDGVNNLLTWGGGIDVAAGTRVDVTYQVRVSDTANAGQTLTNSVTARWSSLDGSSPDERTGSGVPAYNDYVATAAAPPLTIPTPTLTLQKSVDKPIANPGDLLHYTLAIHNPTAIRLADFSLIDVLDPTFFQTGSIHMLTLPDGATATVSGDTLTITNLTVTPNADLTIAFEARLRTDLKSGAVVLNQAELQGPWPTPIKSDDPSVDGTVDPTQTLIPADGVVYDVVERKPLAGVTLTMRLASTGADLPASCFVDPSQQNQLTPADGTYKFDLTFGQPECPEGADYVLAVSAVPANFVAEPSLVLPPASSTAYSVPVCANDAIPDTAQCEASASAVVPTTADATYYLQLTLDSTANQLFNNLIPVDPYVEEKIYISKTTPQVNVTRGQLVPYTITFVNTLRSTLPELSLIDTLPAGFKYVTGSARLDGTPLEPLVSGRQLQWDNLEVDYRQKHTLQLLAIVGAGVTEGKYVNQAQLIKADTGGIFSEVATATVRVIPDTTFDCTDVIGKVFDDRNLNGVQDVGEPGLSGARLVTARGLIATADEHGRFHLTCAAVPDEDRGSNFILKLDDRSLPSGYRITTENPQVQRLTRGKTARFNYGATVHRVVSLDLAEGVFEPESTEMRLQWIPRIGLLVEELKKAPSVLRLSYLADVESEAIVRQRLKTLKQEIERHWKLSKGGYRLTIETEVFWRRGGPMSR
ncbi:MAG: isopeptide-forming domain-containing fimbrial protein [Desulfuromonadales bacterium]|nr:isopeptide-forming domain-containing fimbrial protein [Desulfuromonadales bacterium]MDW7757738.1 isopeptide-forming domain-containing fimbrial protein [Desulfuromonadales bacterium]